jgi:hypothetical protein
MTRLTKHIQGYLVLAALLRDAGDKLWREGDSLTKGFGTGLTFTCAQVAQRCGGLIQAWEMLSGDEWDDADVPGELWKMTPVQLIEWFQDNEIDTPREYTGLVATADGFVRSY